MIVNRPLYICDIHTRTLLKVYDITAVTMFGDCFRAGPVSKLAMVVLVDDSGGCPHKIKHDVM